MGSSGSSDSPASVAAQIAAQHTSDSATYEHPRSNTCVVFGDSWSAQCQTQSGAAGAYGSILYNGTRGYMTWANAFLGQRLAVLKYAGIAGQTTAQYLARFTTDVVALAPGWVFVASPGINDKGTGTPVATTQANLTAMFDLAKAAGIRVVILGMPPKSSPADATDTLLSYPGLLNQWLKRQATLRSDLIYIDTFSVLGDGGATGEWLNPTVSNPTDLTSDGIHPATRGAAAIGWQIFQAVKNLIPPTDVLAFGNADTGASGASIAPNFAPGPYFSSGAVAGSALLGTSGSVPTGWQLTTADGSTVDGTVVGSIVAATTVDPTDIYGAPWWRIAITGCSKPVKLYGQVPGGRNAVIVPGDTMQGTAEVVFGTGIAVTANVSLQAGMFNGSFANIISQDLTGGSVDNWPSELGQIRTVLRTPPVVVGASVVGHYLILVVGGNVANPLTASIYVRRPGLWRNAPMGV